MKEDDKMLSVTLRSKQFLQNDDFPSAPDLKDLPKNTGFSKHLSYNN